MASRWELKPVEYMGARIPDDFFKETLLALRDANRIALARCRDLEPEWRVGTLAHLRREYFNKLWGPVARRHGGKARPVLNGNNATNHLEVTLHGIIFTPVAVQTPNEFPRDADYRNTLAAGNQLDMLAKLGLEEEQPAAEAQLYAVFGYSSDMDEESGLPLFAHVGFPHKRKKKYVDLRSLFSLIVELGNSANDAQTPTPSPDVADTRLLPTEQPSTAAEFKEERTDEEEPPLRYIADGAQKPTQLPSAADKQSPSTAQPPTDAEFKEECTDEEEPPLSFIPKVKKDTGNE